MSVTCILRLNKCYWRSVELQDSTLLVQKCSLFATLFARAREFVQHRLSYNVGWPQFRALTETLPISSKYVIQSPLQVLFGRKADNLTHGPPFAQKKQSGCAHDSKVACQLLASSVFKHVQLEKPDFSPELLRDFPEDWVKPCTPGALVMPKVVSPGASSGALR